MEFAELAGVVIGSAALTFDSAAPQIAAAGCPSFVPFFEGCISGVAPGLTSITAELDLTGLGLGKGTDSVLTWVLPRIESAQLEPPSLTMCTADPAIPGPPVRTFGTVEAIQQAVIPIPSSYQNATKFIERMFPPSWLSLGTAGRYFTFADGFKVFVSFGVTLSGTTVTINNARFGFHMPTLFTSYTPPGLIADIGTETTFDTFIEHQGVVGVGQLLTQASIPPLGSATATGTIAVRDCTADLSLRPVLIPIVQVPSQTIQLHAVQTTGQTELDVTVGLGTRYYSLSQPIPNAEGPVAVAVSNTLRQLADDAIQRINAELTQQACPSSLRGPPPRSIKTPASLPCRRPASR